MVSLIDTPPEIEISQVEAFVVIIVGCFRLLYRDRAIDTQVQQLTVADTNQGNHSSLVTPPQIMLDYIGCFLYNEFVHMSKDYPWNTFIPTPISIVRGGLQKGKSATIGARGRGRDRGVCGGGRNVTQSRGRLSQFYKITTKFEVEASNTVIIGFILVCYRFVSILFNPSSICSYVSNILFQYFVLHVILFLFFFIFLPSQEILCSGLGVLILCGYLCNL